MKRFIIAVAIIVVLGATALTGGYFAANAAREAIEKQRHDILGLAIDIGSYDIDWGRSALTLNDIKIYPAGHEEEASLLASAEKLRVKLSARDMLNKTLHAKEILLVKPKLTVIHSTPGEWNWDALRLGGTATEPGAESSQKTSDWRVVVDAVRIEDGEAAYKDRVKEHNLELFALESSLTDIESETDPEKLPSKLTLTADVGRTGGKINVEGMVNAFAEGINFAIKAHLTSTPITYFHSFYAGETPYPIQSGSIAISSKAEAVKGMLKSSHHATIHNLRIGGGVKSDLINKFILSRNGPIEVNAQVNGDLSEGKLSVGTQISRGISLGILDQAKNFSPLNLPSKAADGVKRAGESVGTSVRRIFRR